MNRNRASAKKAGTAFETLVAGFLAERLGDDRIERRTKNGAKDRGDIAGVRDNPALHPPPPRRRSGCSEGSDWWRGYRQAQRECLQDALKAADQVAGTEGSKS